MLNAPRCGLPAPGATKAMALCGNGSVDRDEHRLRVVYAQAGHGGRFGLHRLHLRPSGTALPATRPSAEAVVGRRIARQAAGATRRAAAGSVRQGYTGPHRRGVPAVSMPSSPPHVEKCWRLRSVARSGVRDRLRGHQPQRSHKSGIACASAHAAHPADKPLHEANTCRTWRRARAVSCRHHEVGGVRRQLAAAAASLSSQLPFIVHVRPRRNFEHLYMNDTYAAPLSSARRAAESPCSWSRIRARSARR
jgi:hypothetical protein